MNEQKEIEGIRKQNIDARKEIEDIAKVLYGQYCKVECAECILQKRCAEYHRAELICFAGYRKAAEVRKETAREIFELLKFGYELPIDDIAKEILEKYGVEVEE